MSFCFCTDQKDVAKNVYEVDQELGGGEYVSFCVPGGVLRGGHGYKYSEALAPP